MEDSLHERGKAMEDMFFKEIDDKLIANMRRDLVVKCLRDASGIDDTEVLEALMKAGITPETMTSISIVPLVAVAWADRTVADAERAAILQAAETAGLSPGHAGYELMNSWLSERPKSELLEAWKGYIGAIKPNLDPAAFTQLKHSILGRAETVAKSAGGFLGIGNKVSDAEQKVIDTLNRAFD